MCCTVLSWLHLSKDHVYMPIISIQCPFQIIMVLAIVAMKVTSGIDVILHADCKWMIIIPTISIIQWLSYAIQGMRQPLMLSVAAAFEALLAFISAAGLWLCALDVMKAMHANADGTHRRIFSLQYSPSADIWPLIMLMHMHWISYCYCSAWNICLYSVWWGCTCCYVNRFVRTLWYEWSVSISVSFITALPAKSNMENLCRNQVRWCHKIKLTFKRLDDSCYMAPDIHSSISIIIA